MEIYETLTILNFLIGFLKMNRKSYQMCIIQNSLNTRRYHLCGGNEVFQYTKIDISVIMKQYVMIVPQKDDKWTEIGLRKNQQCVLGS